MAEQLQKTFHGTAAEEAILILVHYYSTMKQVMQNPQFMTMAERLGDALMKDPSMSSMLENLTNPSHTDLLDEQMAHVNCQGRSNLETNFRGERGGGSSCNDEVTNIKVVFQQLFCLVIILDPVMVYVRIVYISICPTLTN